MSALIECKDAVFAYEGHVVIDKLNLSIPRGDYLCVVGENGSGKSTLIKGLLGLLAPLHGTVSYGDGLKHCEIGYLPQASEHQRDFPASVWEVVTSGCRTALPFINAAQRALAEKNMALLKVDSIRKQSFMELSGGQRRRVLLARALCATRSMLLLDEPAAALDPLAAKDMYDVIESLSANGLTVVMISHDIAAALRYAKHVLHMSRGSTFYGTVDEYRESALGSFFFGGIENA